jgi:hypothetical protein
MSAMQTIIITVAGEELESLNLELTAEEVTALYKLRKEQTAKVAELEKKLTDLEKSKKYTEEKLSSATDEIQQANTLLTALGIQEKTGEEEAYYRKVLNISTRIALYIATKR